MPESKSSKRRIEAKEKQKQALQMRMAGLTFDQIAERLGYKTKAGAFEAVNVALNGIPEADAKLYKRVNLERLNRLLVAFWSIAISGDHKAAAMCLSIMVEMSKLAGAYAPVEMKLDITDRIRELAKAEGMDPDEAVREAQKIMEGLE
jgi:hypothetical protein